MVRPLGCDCTSEQLPALLPRAAIAKLFATTPLGFTLLLCRLLLFCHKMLYPLSLDDFAIVHKSAIECKQLRIEKRFQFAGESNSLTLKTGVSYRP